MKRPLAIFTLAVILLGSCRKEIQTNQVDVSKLATTAAVSATPIISNVAIANWFVKNPMGQYLTVDWKKAKQATVGNVAVVTVPLKNISIPGLSGSKKTNDLTAGSTGALTAFDPYHPPCFIFSRIKPVQHLIA